MTDLSAISSRSTQARLRRHSRQGWYWPVEFYTGKKGAKDSVHLEQNILVTKGGYERLSLWVAEELMECWLPYE